MATDPSAGDEITRALEREDAQALTRATTDEELKRLKRAEEVLELSHNRRRRTQRSAQFAQAMVGYVALAGFFANAYQSYTNKKDSEARAQKESERWEKEFKRAQDADKYRAFFETSALATDPQNADKRLVGYALLKEFVDDANYDSKAIIMLEESLALELRGDGKAEGLGEQRRLAVEAILGALSHSPDCRTLARAARTVQRLTHMRPIRRAAGRAAPPPLSAENLEEQSDAFEMYVRRLVGRAAVACQSPREFREVRQPLQEALVQQPALAGGPPQAGTGKMKPGDANARIAELLRASCDEERQEGAVSDCDEVALHYQRLCAEMAKEPGPSDETAACAVVHEAVGDAGKAPRLRPAPSDGGG